MPAEPPLFHAIDLVRDHLVARGHHKVLLLGTRLADGATEPGFASWFADLITRHAAQGCEAVIAGCTELPLVIAQESSAIEVVDPLQLQCHACVDFALG